MKKKQYFYRICCGRRIDIMGINTWLCGCKDYSYKWDMLNKENVYGVKTLPKRRHRRTWAGRNRFKIWGYSNVKIVLYSRPAEPIGRKKHGKWLRMPKRIVGFVRGLKSGI